MKTRDFQVLTLILLSVAFVSCNKNYYQVVHIGSNAQAKSNFEELISDKDSVRVFYSFNDYGLPLYIKIFNNHRDTIHVHWEASYVDFNGTTYSYYSPASRIRNFEKQYSNDKVYSSREELREGYEGVQDYIRKNAQLINGDKITKVAPGGFVDYYSIRMLGDTISESGYKSLYWHGGNTTYYYPQYADPKRNKLFFASRISVLKQNNDSISIETDFWIDRITSSTTKRKTSIYNPHYEHWQKEIEYKNSPANLTYLHSYWDEGEILGYTAVTIFISALASSWGYVFRKLRYK
ncbi:MAG: hypothetical protein ACK4K0_06135 [Flavobacteriales bacterium]